MSATERSRRATRVLDARGGFSLVEVAWIILILGILSGGATAAFVGLQKAFTESQAVSGISLRAQHAMERLATVLRGATTTDPAYELFSPVGGGGFHGLKFRVLDSVNAGSAVYDDDLVVFVYGAVAGGGEPCSGLIVGRGPDLATVHSLGQGSDGILGTRDDDTTAAHAGGQPAVELLIPSNYAPETGDLFTIETDPASSRILLLTLRLNVRNRHGEFIFPNDHVVVKRVSLSW